ncbi:hypothetical protein NJ76_21155 [Rhodococcus sp. IITR03]|nr:hypothetical protein NJ76_21155 [Rhodococcus sp. IITR03]
MTTRGRDGPDRSAHHGSGGDPALRPRRLLLALRAHSGPPGGGAEPHDPTSVVDALHRFDDDAVEIEQQ